MCLFFGWIWTRGWSPSSNIYSMAGDRGTGRVHPVWYWLVCSVKSQVCINEGSSSQVKLHSQSAILRLCCHGPRRRLKAMAPPIQDLTDWPSCNQTRTNMSHYGQTRIQPMRFDTKGFHQLGPTGPSWSVSHHVRVSVCVSAPSGAVFFRPLIGPQVIWSVPGLSLVLPSSLPW